MRRTTRRLLAMVSAVAALVGVGLASGSSLAAAGVQGASNRVIVVFKNQEKALPPTHSLAAQRRSAVAAVQAPVTSQLRASGAKQVQSYSVINALSASVSPSEESQLRSNPAVSEVIPDQLIQLAPPQTAGTLGPGTTPTAPLPGTCSADPNNPQLDPQALELINADSDVPGAKTARSLGFDGSGVTVGYIADGLDTQNPDFMRNGTSVFTQYEDFTGAGTSAPTGGGEAFGDASSIAAQGNQVYNVQNYSALPSSTPCYIKIEGVAPGANLVGLVAFSGDTGFNSSILEAINYAVNTAHVNVLNESFGANNVPDDSASLDLIKQADDNAVAAGVVVTVSSGDAGPTSTIGSPATDTNMISAGATTSYRLDAQIGYGGSRFPGVTGFLNNNVSSFSSGGFDAAGGTVDVVAPGELNWVLCTADLAQYSECANFNNQASSVLEFGGTSESSPLTAGVAALVIQAYRSTHAGATPTPAVVKQIITSTATDIGAPADQQGAGELNAYKAVEAAESYGTTGVGSTLLESSSQLNAVAATGTHESLTDTITNNGSAAQTVRLSTRAIGAYTTLKTADVTLSDSGGSQTTDWQGVTDNVETVHFNVPSGQDRLNAAIAFQNSNTSLNARVRLTLVDSQGRLAGYSVPQGDGNYGDIQVTDPAAGSWTAYIYSRDSAAGGTTGPVVFQASSATYTSFGTVSPSTLTLMPGQSEPVRLSVTTPAQPGDAAGAIMLNSGSGGTTSIPVTLRSMVPVGPATWVNTLTGGNGRGVNTGEAFYYQINLPSGEPELNASITLANNPNNSFYAWLVDPAGQAEAYTSNGELTLNSQGNLNLTSQLGGQLHVLSPQSGKWTLVVVYAPAVSGTAISEPFAVSMNEQGVPASVPSLPNSKREALTAGKTYTYNVHIRNTGNAPELYFVDPRLNTSTTMNLASLTGSSDTQAPLSFTDNIPQYLIPTDATQLVATASTDGTEPIVFDSSTPAGDPDILASPSTGATSVSASLSANPLTQGDWSIAPTVTGPFTTAQATPEAVATSMTVTAAAFDPAATTKIGDVWEAGAAGGIIIAPPVKPGASETIPVKITPSGPSGSTVTGTLYVDDEQAYLFGGLAPNGNQVAAVPYQYKVR